MKHWARRIPFKVDIAGVIRIMGSALYSRPDAAIRELIQNAHDAVTRRRQQELDYKGRIGIRQNRELNTIEFSDDGIGLSAEEAEKYLGTLGVGLTGLLKGTHPAASHDANDDANLIGMFGIGLFSAFMLADEMIVESKRIDADEGVIWKAGEGTDIEIASFDKATCGTTIRLVLKPELSFLSENEDAIEQIVKDYADFLTVPIFLNDSPGRANVINVSWFDPTPDAESIELDLASYFNETPLDVIPVQIQTPIPIHGALYVSPERTPGFAGEPVVTATVRRMVISRHIRDLLPDWASFLRGVIEVRKCSPTASREDLQRNGAFDLAKNELEEFLYKHFDSLADNDPVRMESVLTWHRYSWAGAALGNVRIRKLLQRTYKFPTSQGQLTFDEIIDRSLADPLFEAEFDRVVWYNTDRRQEAWVNSLFDRQSVPCVHTLRSFEETLLGLMVGDYELSSDMRFASPASNGFANEILQIGDVDTAPNDWQEYLNEIEAHVSVASFQGDLPVMAFLNEKHEIKRTFDELKKSGSVPPGFQRIIESHFNDQDEEPRNEILLNRNHRLVARALEQSTRSPLASVLRLLVANALRTAGAALPASAQKQQSTDLDWIAECLWGKNDKN